MNFEKELLEIANTRFGKRISIAKNFTTCEYNINCEHNNFEISRSFYNYLIQNIDGEYFEENNYEGYNIKRKHLLQFIKPLTSRRAYITEALQNL